jgi:hypothetical protein
MFHSARALVAGAIAVILAGPAVAEDPTWSQIQPARSTESQIYTWFGAPTEVLGTFSWQAWVARSTKPLTTKSYKFRYRTGESSSSLLDGPAGPADSATVDIFNGLVSSVEWLYGGPPARAAAQVLRADPEMEFSSPTSPCHAWKPTSHGRVFAELGEDDSEVRVVYDLK